MIATRKENDMADVELFAKIMRCFPKDWKITPELINKLNDTIDLIELYNRQKGGN